MASILKVDQLQSDSGTVNLASNISFSGAATIVGNIANPTITGTLNLIGGGIKFPSTQVSSADGNTLDDYEEGTWTPIVKRGSTGPTIPNPTNYVVLSGSSSVEDTTAAYVKIGRVVHCCFSIRFAAGEVGQTARYNVSLPFAYSGSGYGIAGSVGLYKFNQTLNQGLFLGVGDSGNSIDFFDLGPTNGTHTTLSVLLSSEVYFNFCYLTA